ncbi:MAG: hypothetical protein ABIU30_18455 [Ferruginibacter sp.]
MQPKQQRPHKHDWQNHLQAIKDLHDRNANPEAYRANGPNRGKWEDATANGLTKAIVDYLNYIGGNFTRINVMGTPRKNGHGQLIFTPSTTKPGTADILGCYKSRYIAIEVKIGADRQSKEQIQEQKDVTAAGGIYIVAKDFPTFLSNFFYTVKIDPK